jgi:GNAT superfamily N-acetyltransferase
MTEKYDESGIITAQVDGKDAGILDYMKLKEAYLLGGLSVFPEYQRTGIATALVEEFVYNVGSGVPVNTTIVNYETLDELYKQGIFFQAAQGKNFTLLGLAECLPNSPLIKALNRGGIQSEYLSIQNRGIPLNSFESNRLLEQYKGRFQKIFKVGFRGVTV